MTFSYDRNHFGLGLAIKQQFNSFHSLSVFRSLYFFDEKKIFII